MIGSAAAYEAGYYGGRPFLLRWGPWLLITPEEIASAKLWFARWGDRVVFYSRLLPVVRTFISLPPGVARLPFFRFLVLTFAGAFPFSLVVAYIGLWMGEYWTTIAPLFHRFSWFLVGAFAAALLWFYGRRVWATRRATADRGTR